MAFFLFALIMSVLGVFEIYLAVSYGSSQDVSLQFLAGSVFLALAILTLYLWRRVRRSEREAKRRREAMKVAFRKESYLQSEE